MSSSTDLDRVRRAHQLRSLRIAAVLRIGVVAVMTGAMVMGTSEREWPKECVLLVLYGVAAAVILAFSRAPAPPMGPSAQFALAIIDVLIVFSFQLLSTGGYVPLLVLGLLPILVVLEVSWRRAAVVLARSVVAFTVSMLADPVMWPHLGWGETLVLVGICGLLGCAVWVVVYFSARHVDEITDLNASREALSRTP